MRIAGADKAVGNVIEWSLRDDDWAEEWAHVLADHLAPVCEDLGLEPEMLESTLGSDGFGIVLRLCHRGFSQPQLRKRGPQRRR